MSYNEKTILRNGGMVNSFDAANLANIDSTMREMIEKRAKVLGPIYRLFYENPVHFVRAEGVYLYDAAGNAYLDVYNNVPSVGHCHPAITQAVTDQMQQLNTHTRYLFDGMTEYAEDLLSEFPDEIAHVLFTCTGSEASDLATRIARYYTKGEGFIVTENAYHGHTTQICGLSPSLGANVALHPETRLVKAPDEYHCDGNVGQMFAQSVQSQINDMERHGIKFAGLITDTIFSSDGILPGPAGFLKDAVDIVHKAGGLFLADEVQPGFGRTGEKTWGFQRHDVVPDLVIMGKPMGNGMPIGGIALKPHVVEKFARETRYFNTFGGNPLCIAAAQAVLNVLRDEDLQKNSLTIGREMVAGAQKIALNHECIGHVRGAGLFVGIELVKSRETKEPDGDKASAVVNLLREKRVLISTSGAKGNVLKVRPPLPFTSKDNTLFLDRLEETLAELADAP